MWDNVNQKVAILIVIETEDSYYDAKGFCENLPEYSDIKNFLNRHKDDPAICDLTLDDILTIKVTAIELDKNTTPVKRYFAPSRVWPNR